MPGSTGNSERSTKRKRVSSEKRSSKRARSESSEEDAQAQILLLENEILESRKNYNNIATLIKILQTDDEGADQSIFTAVSLCRVFTRLMAMGDMSRDKKTSEKDVVVVQWLTERYSEYKTTLLLLLEEDVTSSALTLCMRLMKSEGEHFRRGQDYIFPAVFLSDILQKLLKPECDESVRRGFSEMYVEEYDDVRYYTFDAIEKIIKNGQMKSTEIFDQAIQILTATESVPESKEELEDFYIPAPKKKAHALFSLTQHKIRAQGAWLALMNMEMSKKQRKSVLTAMTKSIAPWFMKPEFLMDFLTDSYNAGGSTSLLALSGVFYLIQEKNLDYPSFYRKLYSLLDSEILYSKHRSRFFRLLDIFLASTHLPAVLVASFLKRLSRLSLNATPAGVVAVVPWIYNLLKKHPSCTFMIHRETKGAGAKEILENEGMDDPFNAHEQDPMETNAIDSCLWEIVMLQSHYHPNVATLAKIISEQFTKHAYNLEDFLDHSYGSMLEAELSKDVKKIPVVEYEIPKKIFMKQDATTTGVEDSLLVTLWDFS
ncbi:hypothetical protein B7494_g8349 [Chlorociboria aeruginascens]|nr:hypothetical protein B7494_g8349 [Chlorociboria aeruginascens]